MCKNLSKEALKFLKNGMVIKVKEGREFDIKDGYMIDRLTKYKIKLDEIYDEGLLIKENKYEYDESFNVVEIKFSIDEEDGLNCKWVR